MKTFFEHALAFGDQVRAAGYCPLGSGITCDVVCLALGVPFETLMPAAVGDDVVMLSVDALRSGVDAASAVVHRMPKMAWYSLPRVRDLDRPDDGAPAFFAEEISELVRNLASEPERWLPTRPVLLVAAHCAARLASEADGEDRDYWACMRAVLLFMASERFECIVAVNKLMNGPFRDAIRGLIMGCDPSAAVDGSDRVRECAEVVAAVTWNSAKRTRRWLETCDLVARPEPPSLSNNDTALAHGAVPPGVEAISRGSFMVNSVSLVSAPQCQQCSEQMVPTSDTTWSCPASSCEMSGQDVHNGVYPIKKIATPNGGGQFVHALPSTTVED